MFRRSKSKRKGNSPFAFLFVLLIGMVLAAGASVLATTVGTNISITGTLTTNSSTASSSVSYALGVATTTPATALAVVGSTYTTLGLGAGIATTTTGALEITGSAYFAGDLSVTDDATIASGLGVGIATSTTGNFEITGSALFGDAAADLVMLNAATIVHNNVGTSTIKSSSADAWSYATSTANIPLLKFDTSNTRIGISTTTPGATLGVAGTIYSSGSITTTGGLGSGISTTTAGAFEITGNALFGDAAADLVMLNAASIIHNNKGTTTILSANADSWNIATSSANIPFLKFDTSNYRIGISTTSPGATFSVAGNAYITGNLSVGTNGTNVATIQHAWILCGPATGAYTLAATTTGHLLCNGNMPQGHAANDKVWLTASSTAATGPSQGWYDYTGKASSTAAGTIQVMIFNNSGATLTNANLGTTSWQLLLIK